MAADDPIEARPSIWFRPVALVTLREEGSCGYELMERLAEFGFEDINPAALYRMLWQTEQEGLCESHWESASNGVRARRAYSITNEGKAYLAAWGEVCKRAILVHNREM